MTVGGGVYPITNIHSKTSRKTPPPPPPPSPITSPHPNISFSRKFPSQLEHNFYFFSIQKLYACNIYSRFSIIYLSGPPLRQQKDECESIQKNEEG